MGSATGTLTFDIGDGTAHPNARVVDDPGASGVGKTVRLPVYTGPDAMASEKLPAPTFVKIDVEGFELEVVRGMNSLLRSPTCRSVFIEVHFGLLAQRGQSGAAEAIRKALREMGYTVTWIDASHIQARR